MMRCTATECRSHCMLDAGHEGPHRMAFVQAAPSATPSPDQPSTEDLRAQWEALVADAIRNGNDMAGLHVSAQSFSALTDDALSALKERDQRIAELGLLVRTLRETGRNQALADDIERWRQEASAAEADRDAWRDLYQRDMEAVQAERDALAERLRTVTETSELRRQWMRRALEHAAAERGTLPPVKPALLTPSPTEDR